MAGRRSGPHRAKLAARRERVRYLRSRHPPIVLTEPEMARMQPQPGDWERFIEAMPKGPTVSFSFEWN